MNFPQERRKHPRIAKHFIITYYEDALPDSQHNVSQLKNISRGGLCFSSCVSYENGAVLKVLIKTPYMAETISAKGIVVDSLERIPGVIYEIHLELQTLTTEAQNVLQKIEKMFIDSHPQ